MAKDSAPEPKERPGSQARLPPFLGKPRAKSTDFPVADTCHPELRGPRTDPFEKMAELSTHPPQSEPQGEEDRDPSDCLEDAVFAMSGFGEFPVTVVNGQYASHLAGTFRRSPNGEKELFACDGGKCVIPTELRAHAPA